MHVCDSDYLRRYYDIYAVYSAAFYFKMMLLLLFLRYVTTVINGILFSVTYTVGLKVAFF